MTTVSATETLVLNEESIPSYLAERADAIGVFPPNAILTAKPITGGNVNFAFRVSNTVENGSNSPDVRTAVFVKQAPEYVAIFGPGAYPLTSERMQMEIDVYKEWMQVDGVSQYLPQIYLFDPVHMATVMQFLDGYELLDHLLIKKEHKEGFFNKAATQLGDFMGKTHGATHSSKMAPDRVAYLVEHFENRPMRDIQLEFVFTKCFKEATDEQRAGLTVDERFMKEVALIKAQYNGEVGTENLVLSHGDLHPGSVMANPDTEEVKVIDPEFTVYGPPGLDVGSLLSGFVLAAIHHAYSNDTDEVASICDAVQTVWDSYTTAIHEYGVSPELVKEIESQAVGFTTIEVCRTALEFAGGRLWLQFDDATVKAKAKRAALELVSKCMIDRHEGGIQLLIKEMKSLADYVG